jgi:hypothetical protein
MDIYKAHVKKDDPRSNWSLWPVGCSDALVISTVVAPQLKSLDQAFKYSGVHRIYYPGVFLSSFAVYSGGQATAKSGFVVALLTIRMGSCLK